MPGAGTTTTGVMVFSVRNLRSTLGEDLLSLVVLVYDIVVVEVEFTGVLPRFDSEVLDEESWPK